MTQRTTRWILSIFLLASLVAGCSDNTAAPVKPKDGQAKVVASYESVVFAPPGGLKRLDDPISPKKTQQMRQDFDWASTQDLEVHDSDGNPAIYYAMIYVHNRQELDLVDRLAWYHSSLPIFHSEQAERWGGKTGVFGFDGDGQGVFVFTMLAGGVYNELRKAALAGKPAFAAVILRDVPEDIGSGSGPIPYDTLAKHGILQAIFGTHASADQQQAGLHKRSQKLIAEAVRGAANAAVDLFDEGRRAATEVVRFFAGTARFLIHIHIDDIDPLFRSADQPEMWSSWRNAPIKLTGAMLRLQDDALLSDEPLDDTGTALIHTTQDLRLHLCIAAKNPAGFISEHVVPMIVCHFATGHDFAGHRDITMTAHNGEVTELTFHLTHYAFNILAQLTDSRDYVRQVFGRTQRRAYVLVGPFANIIGQHNGGLAATICAGAPSPLRDMVEGTVGLAGGLAAALTPLASAPVSLPGLDIAAIGVAALINTILSNDIIFPGAGNTHTAANAPRSRGVPTHEYGHFTMCEMIRHITPVTLSTAMADIIRATLDGGQDNPDNGELVFAEAFADFFAYNVVAGTNYFNTAVSGGHTGFSSRDVYYCNADRADPTQCLEDNLGGQHQQADPGDFADEFHRRVGVTASVLYDAFDGATAGPGEVPPAMDTGWHNVATSGPAKLAGSTRGPYNSGDEAIALPGSALYQMYGTWAAAPNFVFSRRSIYDALARVMLAHGYTAEQICTLFALHQPEGHCHELLSDGVLDRADIPPRAPVMLTAHLFDGARINDVRFTWRDSSVDATGFRWHLEGDDGDSRDGTMDWSATPEKVFSHLHSNVRYRFQVWTVNGPVEAGPTTAEVVTYADPTTITDTTELPAGVELGWQDSGASQYAVEIGVASAVSAGDPNAWHEVQVVDTTSTRLHGLQGDVHYVARVWALNEDGVRSTASNEVDFTPARPTFIYVTPSGDDANPGTQALPYATIGRALQAANAQVAAQIVVAPGTYTETAALRVTGDVQLRSSTSGSRPTIQINAMTDTTTSCSAGEFNADQRPARAALALTPGGHLTINNVHLSASDDAADAQSACRALIASEGNSLTLDHTVLNWTDNPLSGASCASLVQVRNAGTVTLQGADLDDYIATADTSAPSNQVETAALCVQDTASVGLTDTHLRTRYNVPRDTHDGGLHRMVAAAFDGIDRVRASRSLFETLDLPNKPQSWYRTGAITGLYARANDEIFIDNSIAATTSGGDVNRGLDLGSADGSGGADVYLYFVTADVGDDNNDQVNNLDGHTSSALRLSGTINHLELYDSLLSNLSGNAPHSQTRTGVDMLDMDTPLCAIRAEGNVVSVTDVGSRAVSVVWGTGEFDAATTEIDISSDWMPGTCTAPRRIGHNIVLYDPATDSATDNDNWVVNLNSDSAPAPYHFFGGTQQGSYQRVATQGISLTSMPKGPQVGVGYGATASRTGSPLQAGAWPAH